MRKQDPLNSISALHHVIVIQKHPKHFKAFPALYTFEEPGGKKRSLFQPLSDYFLDTSAQSQTTHRYTAKGVGLLHDYAVQRGGDELCSLMSGVNAKQLMTDFANHLVSGTIGPDFSDPLGLFWPPAGSHDVVRNLVSGMEAFLESAQGQQTWPGAFDHLVLRASTASGCAAGEFSLLKHIKHRSRATGRKDTVKWIASESKRKSAEINDRKRFPEDLMIHFTTRSFITNARLAGGRPKTDLTGKLSALISLGGGRASERLHMWVNDLVAKEEKVYGFLRHPQLFEEVGSGLTREQFLLKYYRQRPRNLLNGRLRVGFKNPLLNGA